MSVKSLVKTKADPEMLKAFADRANAEHAAYEVTQRAAVAHAMAAGDALIQAKARLRHGEWLPWLRENFDGSRQTADNYRRLAANCQRVGNLDSIRGALAELADPRPARRSELQEACRRLIEVIERRPTHDEAARMMHPRVGRYEPFGPPDPKMLRQEIAGCEARLDRLRTMLAESEPNREERDER